MALGVVLSHFLVMRIRTVRGQRVALVRVLWEIELTRRAIDPRLVARMNRRGEAECPHEQWRKALPGLPERITSCRTANPPAGTTELERRFFVPG